jgi:23S rRNA (cytosine1962-C5)-methyltransferase
MRATNHWKDYELLDTSSGERLERWGDILLIRPDPQVIWNTPKKHPGWKQAHARYHRSKTGGGHWEYLKPIPEVWGIDYEGLTFQLKPMGFKHTGLFPEQAVNWDWCMNFIGQSKKPMKVLNLFAYTGGATLACSKAGASVTHVDASKGMVAWAKENAVVSGLADQPLRWLVDDCIKFVKREIRRGNKYDGIILDPPSYGRGPGGEVWQLEEKLYDFLLDCREILNPDYGFMVLNSYTTGLSPSVMGYLLGELLVSKFGGEVVSDEIGLKVTQTGLVLPCGATSIWYKK